MKTIEVLDQQTIDKIAAGEVVERPSSVVKELVENAIDAGSNAVTVEIRDGGTSLIRITDNGEGIDIRQVPLAFLRHATSKIKKVEDLIGVTSLGFRGEALSSIAAVCQVELITKTAGSLIGIRYQIEGGVEKGLEEIGAPEGTTFLVRNIFYNTPARKKFLKSPTTEAGYINDLMERLALSHPNVSFKFISNNQTKMHTSGNANLKDIIYNVYGREIAGQLLSIECKNEMVQISGYVGKPVISRGNRNYENYFINGRYIKSSVISKAIEDAYKTFMMQHKYPFTALHFTMDGDLLDINVHPTKMELRFADNEAMYQMVYEVIRKGLSQKELIPEVSVSKSNSEKAEPKAKTVSIPEPFEKMRLEQMREHNNYHVQTSTVTGKPKPLIERHFHKTSFDFTKSFGDNTESAQQINRTSDGIVPYQADIQAVHKPKEDISKEGISKEDIPQTNILSQQISNGNISNEQLPNIETKNSSDSTEQITQQTNQQTQQSPEQQPQQMDLFEEKLLSKKNITEHKLIGQIFDTYWLVEFQEKLYIIDQHAAHEKVLYERTMKNLESKTFTSQYLSPPIILSLSMQEEELLNRYMDNFTQIGFEIEPFGGKEYSIRAIPDNLFGIAQKELFIEMLDTLSEQSGYMKAEMINEKIASMSCKAAVKGNHRMSAAEAEALIGELLTLENPYNCPHGRPTIIAMTKYELEKKFKRIV